MSKKIFKAPSLSKKAMDQRKKESVSYESSYDNRESISIHEKDIPEIATWEVGKSYKIEATLLMTSKDMRTDAGEDQNKHSARFKITAISVDTD